MDIDFITQRVEDVFDLLDRKLVRRLDVFVFAQSALRHSCADRQLLLADAAFLAKFSE
jgi:hypothetical protein